MVGYPGLAGHEGAFIFNFAKRKMRNGSWDLYRGRASLEKQKAEK